MYRRETPWDIVKPLLFFLGSILWLEGIYRAFYVRPFFDVGLVYILLFSLPLAGMCALLTSLWGKKGNRQGRLRRAWRADPVVHDPVGVPHDLCHRAGHQVLQHGRSGPGSYWKETLLGIWEALPALLLLAVPLVVYFFQPRFALLNRPDGRVLLGVIGGVIIVQAAAVLAIALPTGGIMTTRQIYRETFVPDLTVSHFGLPPPCGWISSRPSLAWRNPAAPTRVRARSPRWPRGMSLSSRRSRRKGRPPPPPVPMSWTSTSTP